MASESVNPLFGVIIFVVISAVIGLFVGAALQFGFTIEQDARASVDIQEFNGDTMVSVNTLDNSDFIFLVGFDGENFNTTKEAFYIESSGDYRLETADSRNVSFRVKAVIGEESGVFKNSDENLKDGQFVNLRDEKDSVKVNTVQTFDMS
jgi:hypothetical protein